MRDIEFRGKRADNGGWVYGSLMTLFYPTDELCITCPGSNQHWSNTQFIKVIHETVGQYTGLKDKNGVKIFEGDIFMSLSQKGIVKEEKGRWICDWYTKPCWLIDVLFPHVIEGEVIGSIHDNPELKENK